MKKYENTINGLAVNSVQNFETYNPATNQVIGLIPSSDDSQINDAVMAARNAQKSWANKPDEERKAILMQVADKIDEHAEYLAKLVTEEQGKPLGGIGPTDVPGSRFEIKGCEVWTRVPATLDLPNEVVNEDETRIDEKCYKPFGVIVAIAPWNWPILIATWQIMASIRMGNTIVIKPSEYTSAGTLEFVRIINEVLPAGVVNTVSGGAQVGSSLVSHKDIDKIMFTGSADTGKKIAAIAAEKLIPVTLELGGNDAAIVLEDANVKEMAMGMFWGSFINMGQTCACIKRLYVHEKIYDETVAQLKGLAEAMPMGNGLEDGIAMGPIQNKMQFDKVKNLVEQSKASGAKIVCGGEPMDRDGHFYPLTLITDVNDHDRIVREEQFGPVLPIIKFSDANDAVKSANSLDVGLGASVWSSNLENAKKIANLVQAGTVWINQHGMIHPMVPFGGIKKSGYGVEFGIEGLKSVAQIQMISTKK